ncbi:MAG: helix-turn-helix domain-containing protein [Pseudomonadota bacterium]
MSKIRPDAQNAIIEAAFIVYAERPTASLGDVAERAGVGRATLHRYFAGRADLMRALALTAMEELEQAVTAQTAPAENYGDGFRLALHAIVPLADRQLFLAQEGLEADPQVAAAYQASRDQLHADVEAAKAEGFFAADMPTAWIVTVFENLIYAAWSLVRDGEATPKQAAELAWHTLSNGLQGDPS